MKIQLPDVQPILIGDREHLFVALSPRWLAFPSHIPEPVLKGRLWPEHHGEDPASSSGGTRLPSGLLDSPLLIF